MVVTKDKSKIDRNIVIEYLAKESYWAQGRSPELIHKSIENSLCFSLLNDGEFVGFCRVITDYTIFSYICDFFILPKYQNQKLGTHLFTGIMEDEELKNTRFLLFTQTAQEFYKKFGFHHDETKLKNAMLL